MNKLNSILLMSLILIVGLAIGATLASTENLSQKNINLFVYNTCEYINDTGGEITLRAYTDGTSPDLYVTCDNKRAYYDYGGIV